MGEQPSLPDGYASWVEFLTKTDIASEYPKSWSQVEQNAEYRLELKEAKDSLCERRCALYGAALVNCSLNRAIEADLTERFGKKSPPSRDEVAARFDQAARSGLAFVGF